jgi:hypothetical protein
MKTEASRRPLKFLLAFSLVVSILPINISNSVAATYGAPSAPQSISQSASASGVALSWSAPASGSPTNYVIERSTNGTTWTSVVTVSSGTTSYTVSSGLSPSTSYYFRIAALAGATQGAFGYPWTKIYGTTTPTRSSGNIVYESGFGIATGNAFSNASTSFSRIRYRMGTTISSVAKYADVDFYSWSTDKTAASVSPSITNLRIPSTSGTSSQFTVHANVTDLNVYSDNSSVTSGFGMSGRLEIWPWNYDTVRSGLSPVGNAGSYDYDDSPSLSSDYGSFQVHDLDNSKPVFVWNRHTHANPEIAYGKNTGSHPDWTFCRDGGAAGTCPVTTSFSMQIYVNSPITTSAVITPANTAVPTISGATTFGETLTSTTGTWSNSPTSYTYQWSRASSSGGSYTNISGATISTYNLVAADVGQYLKVTVTATNASGSAAATSSATAQIAKATPTFSTWTNVVKTFGDANYTVTAPTVTGSLAGSFNYSSNDAAVISISGTTFTVAGGGSATITATFTPTASANYNSAQTTNTVTVNKAAQSAITITTTAATYGSNLTLASTGGSTGGTYNYSKVSGNCTLSGAVLTPTATGSCIVQSNLATTTNYLAETSTATTITISSGSVGASLTLAPGNLTFRQAKNITAVATVAGKITFRVAGKILPGCKNKAVTAGNSFTANCSYRPSNHSYVTITATLDPTDSYYTGTVTRTAQYLVNRRTGTR